MKAEQLFENIGAVDDELLARSEANAAEARRKRRFRMMRIAAAAAVIVVIAGVAVAMKTGIFRKKAPKEPIDETNLVTAGIIDLAKDETLRKYLIASRVMPVMKTAPKVEDYLDSTGMLDYTAYDAACEDWKAQIKPYREKLVQYGIQKAVSGVGTFNAKAMLSLLADRNGENRTYSPINIYMAISMLAELTDGNTRAELLALAGAESIEDLRTRANAMWEYLYKNDDHGKMILGASVWLRDEPEEDASDKTMYNTETLKRLADNYYAASFHGVMGSEEYDNVLRKWLNTQTGGLLKDAVDGLSFDPETVLALATTVWFSGKWSKTFEESQTSTGIFHATSGDVTADFMHEAVFSGNYYYGDRFVSVAKYFGEEASAGMWFILPNEGVSVDDLLNDPEILTMLEQGETYQKRGYARIDLSVPKFDVSYSCDLRETLQGLGVKDVFDPTVSDFTPMVADNSEGYYVSKMEHDARVRIDEDGAEAAAVTIVLAEGTSFPKDEITFTLDRPFLFVIRQNDGIPLFVGVVENPQPASAS
ncbi:MAG: hypothetical protein J5645_00075 [Lachnospiraceae bacterium]|nr:hypothetical protein [Lachnospiraceae bacterium]